MYYFCSPVKASIKSIKPFLHVILTGSYSRPLAFSLLKVGVWWRGLDTLNLHIFNACLFLNGNRAVRLPISHPFLPEYSLRYSYTHLTSYTDGRCLTHWVTTVFENGVLPSLVYPRPWCFIWKSHKETDIHVPIQFSNGTSVLIRMSSMAISPARPFPITPSNTI